MTYLLVALGGAIGAATRYGAVQWVTARTGSAFPWGTLAVNVTGSLLIGVLAVVLTTRDDANLRLLLITGVLGGYTTFSAFSFETLVLILAQRWSAVAYVAGSVLAGLIACGIGYALGLRLMR